MTGTHQASDVFWESQDLARTLFEGSRDAMFLTAADARFVCANPAASELTGYSEEELLARGVADLHGTEALRGLRQAFDKTMAGELTVVEVPILRKDGTTLPVEFTCTPVMTQSAACMHLLVRDLTELRQTEVKLEGSERSSRAWLEYSPICTKIVDPDHNLLFMSRAGIEALGIDDIAQFYGKPYPFDFYPETFCTEMTSNLEKAAETGEAVTQEAGVVDLEGNEMWFHSTIVPVQDRQGRMEYAVVVSIDTTERNMAARALRESEKSHRTERKRLEKREQLERQLQQRQKLESLGVMAGGIAHDFNNILAAILGNADLALLHMPPEAVGRDSLLEIQVAARRASGLTDQMLAYSGRGALIFEGVDLPSLVQEMAQLLEVSHTKKAIVRYQIEEDLPAINGDVSQLRQVVMNLVTNASEAIGEEGGLITVETGVTEATPEYLAGTYCDDELPRGRYVYLEVADTGCGMGEEAQSRIFEPFFTTKFTGRGLGMAAVLGIVRAHKGAIDIQSEVGNGSTIRVLLPALDGPVRRLSEDAPEEQGWTGSGTVLVVDDEPLLRGVAREMLEAKGFTVLTADDGSQAMEVFGEHKDEIVCVLLDLTMPHMGGEETFVALRQVRAEVPVLLVSGYSEEQLKERVEGLEFAGFLKKPFELTELLEAVQSAVKHGG